MSINLPKPGLNLFILSYVTRSWESVIPAERNQNCLQLNGQVLTVFPGLNGVLLVC